MHLLVGLVQCTVPTSNQTMPYSLRLVSQILLDHLRRTQFDEERKISLETDPVIQDIEDLKLLKNKNKKINQSTRN
jgi:hypothetical protein